MLHEKEFIELLKIFYENFSKIDKSKLKTLLSKYSSLEYEYQGKNKTVKKDIKIFNNQKKELIGKVPFILTNENYFPSNASIARFAERAGMPVSRWSKKKKDEIIGSIIINISQLSNTRLTEFNKLITHVLDKTESSNTNDFFLEWDKAIKEMNYKG